MFCYNCGRQLSEHDFCTACGVDVSLYKKIMHVSNMYYNEGLERAGVRDLTGAIISLRQSLKFNKNNVEARNLLGLVYYETGEVVAALSEWVISKNLKPERNIADDYIERLQSNAARLDSMNQTIKKYNQAYFYCVQDSKDLAVIQLKKVLSLNPRFVRARQLLALLYMDMEHWERAERELRKCIEVDRNNTQTLRYLREVESMLTPDDNGKQMTRHKKEEAVRYVSDNEMIIQPVNVKEPKGGGLSTLFNLSIGLLIGLAVTYFLLVPSAESRGRSEAQKTVTEISNQLDNKTVRIQELEGIIDKLQIEKEELEISMEGILGAGGTIQSYDGLLTAASDYLVNHDNQAAAAALEQIAGDVVLDDTSEAFKLLYQTMLNAIGGDLSASYYDEAYEYFRQGDYVAAIESFERASYYDSSNVDALYFLARAYHKNGNDIEAVEVYKSVIERFPDSVRVRDSKRYMKELGVDID